MGHKVNPISARLGYTSQWKSRWFDAKNYGPNLLEDYKIRKLLEAELRKAAVERIEIERLLNSVVVAIHTARPGVIIGRGGAGVEALRQKIKKAIGRDIKLDILEVRNPEGSATVLAHQIVEQIERRMPFRRAIRGVMESASRSRVDGIKVEIAGRLNGAEIARREMFIKGSVPLHTLRHFIDFSKQTAFTTYGTIGVKVWVFRKGIQDGGGETPPNKK
ncbi:30S ribosomal protein S3 [candidate division Kazan bacterium RIFCSPHIGHO2_01_FULL_49_10]|uniref:Small ribosomal subunit protein uS3 n=1 Tax=candidate division Kazan bacterium RIFCSPLOWO2_01_FULL_48_13 TaxID=1798539 RepID=A0A1F4PP79_UNCK3|nr:MAG: 30S ribosomal protein S3 [candidate division Kazan bacterium RIFCSPHIGHO2_01_FULL_49_10]OGB85653.1 MAG: 30S ribosomal protein S3 [candidate division Kazan bacterium RIFCSPLOWO2_01_FULL_48_13]